jgi:hypothetical protein
VKVWPYVVTWIIGSILIVGITLTIAVNSNGTPPPSPLQHEMCTLALTTVGETVPVCEGPDGWVLLDYTGGVCSPECQRICLSRELGEREEQ